ncbi:MAG: BolA family transcriptional regulator [Alphaproteobacteria bacterium]|nr:BolA family transcriptional regulator [Alphaproteobacteria bacterium]
MTDPNTLDGTGSDGGREQRIRAALERDLHPSRLEVIDESHLHHGHAGWSPEGETHFRIRIAGEIFSGRSRVECHRMINKSLAPEFEGGLHALAMEIDR